MSAETFYYSDNRGTVYLPIQLCRSCGKKILWLKNEKTGKLAPINAYPQDADSMVEGNVAIDPHEKTWRVVPAEELDHFGPGMLRLNHFTDCPQRQQWKGDTWTGKLKRK
jgi:hypothetical protein